MVLSLNYIIIHCHQQCSDIGYLQSEIDKTTGNIIVFESGYKLGNFYIIATENIISSNAFMSPDIINNKFEHVWLYGTNPDNGKLWQHDGVAPQEVNEQIIDTDRRRFIEADGKPEYLNFLDAHSSSSYEFIFDL